MRRPRRGKSHPGRADSGFPLALGNWGIMDAGILIPLASFAFVVLIVGITHLAKIREIETEVAQRLHLERMEHERKIRELDLELERVKRG